MHYDILLPIKSGLLFETHLEIYYTDTYLMV